MWNSVHFLGCQECHFHIRIYPTYFPKSFPALVLTVSCGAGNSYLFFYSFSLKIIFHIPRGWGGKMETSNGEFFFFFFSTYYYAATFHLLFLNAVIKEQKKQCLLLPIKFHYHHLSWSGSWVKQSRNSSKASGFSLKQCCQRKMLAWIIEKLLNWEDGNLHSY